MPVSVFRVGIPLRRARLRWARRGWLGSVLLMLWTLPAQAQLISPGELSQAHASFEGIANCTQCHQLGRVGVVNSKCLDCHTPLQQRLLQDQGFHKTVADQNCGTCHKDHFGRDFDVLRFDSESFDHTTTEYALQGAHLAVACRDCHTPGLITLEAVRTFKGAHNALEKTWLGLSAQCASCHTEDDVHAGQFEPQDCAACHAESTWEDTPGFKHEETPFPLTGRHQNLTCESCHTPFADQPAVVHFADLPAQTCATCHTDPHAGALDAICSTCHITTGWDQFTPQFPTARFDHGLTNFALLGAHTTVDCQGCHGKPARQTPELALTFAPASLGATFPKPASDTCTACHTDAFHAGTFAASAGGAVCDNCHSASGWTPTSYDLDRHNAQSGFALTGAHLATPCLACHQRPDPAAAPVFHFENTQCYTCHGEANPHGRQFADAQGETACASCHGTEAWAVEGIFDHARTAFSLTGQHLETACASCHPSTTTPPGTAIQQFRGIPTACAACHGDPDPHAGQFADQTCQTCHDTDAFFMTAFDHTRTRFPLEGAHAEVACGGCHTATKIGDGPRFIRYKPIAQTCTSCHNTP